MPGGKASRQKGDRAERQLVKLLQEAGFAATERCPSSGAGRGDKFGGFDICFPFMGVDLRIEVKHHGSGFKRLYDWLSPVDFLMVRRDHSEPLVIMSLQRFLILVKAAERDAWNA